MDICGVSYCLVCCAQYRLQSASSYEAWISQIYLRSTGVKWHLVAWPCSMQACLCTAHSLAWLCLMGHAAPRVEVIELHFDLRKGGLL